jgi:GntR family transcriptional regulator
MLISIDYSSHVPIFEQIVDQVIFNIAAGGLDAGALIPSVRDLGGQLMVHPNTVAKAYQKLERLGVVEARRGCGMEVTADARKICQTERRERIGERIRAALREAVSSGLSAEEIRRLVEDEIGRINGKRRE